MKKIFAVLAILIFIGAIFFFYKEAPKEAIPLLPEEPEVPEKILPGEIEEKVQEETTAKAKRAVLIETTPTSETVRNPDGTKTLLLYSSVVNVFEDGEWKKVEEARSLKDKGFKGVYTKVDENFNMTLLDFNATSVTLSLKVSEKYSGSSVPLEIFHYDLVNNETDEWAVRIITFNESIFFDSADTTRILAAPFSFGSTIKFGVNSTELILETADTEVLDDGYAGSNLANEFGAHTVVSNLFGPTNKRIFMLKFDLTKIFPNRSIIDARLQLNLTTNNLDDGTEGWDIISQHVYQGFTINGAEWTEGTGGSLGNTCSGAEFCWSTRPDSDTVLNNTQTDTKSFTGTSILTFYTWNVTQMVTNAYLNNDKNISILLNATNKLGAPAEGDTVAFDSKEATDTTVRPLLNITFHDPGPQVDASSYAKNAALDSVLFSHTVSGTKRLLVVGVSIRVAAGSVNSTTYAGQSLTKLKTASNPNGGDVEMWYLINPPTGANNVNVTFDAKRSFVVGAISFTNVSQTHPFNIPNTSTGASLLANITVNSSADELVLDTLLMQGTGAADPAELQTSRWDQDLPADDMIGGGSTKGGASSVRMNWTLSASRDWTYVAVSIRPISCTPNSGENWIIEASDNCTISGQSINVLRMSIVGNSGKFTIRNSNITATSCAVQANPGQTVQVFVEKPSVWVNGC